MYSKTIPVDHGDRYEVASTAFGQVHAAVMESDGTETTTFLDPADARKLARALKRAANVAEGKPAKTPKAVSKPDVIDGDGDVWHWHETGYQMHGCPNDAPRPLEYIRQTYGIRA